MPPLEGGAETLVLVERKRGGAKLVSDILLVSPPGQPRLLQRLFRRGALAREAA